MLIILLPAQTPDIVVYIDSPTTLADTRGAFDDTYADLIRLQNNSGSNVYIIVGIKNNVQLNLTR